MSKIGKIGIEEICIFKDQPYFIKKSFIFHFVRNAKYFREITEHFLSYFFSAIFKVKEGNI